MSWMGAVVVGSCFNSILLSSVCHGCVFLEFERLPFLPYSIAGASPETHNSIKLRVAFLFLTLQDD
jgi:hypothetical protein